MMAEDTRNSDPWWSHISPEPSRASEDLESVMWGGAGVPPADEARVAAGEPDDAPDENDEKAVPATSLETKVDLIEDNGSSNDSQEEVLATGIAWKQRSGLGKYYVGYVHNAWEQRRVVLVGTKILYYSIDDGDDETAPRGVLDLVEEENPSVEIAEGSSGAPAPYEIDIKVDGETKWKFCFEHEEVQLEWYAKLRAVLIEAGIVNNTPFDHDFEAGDHIVRWEMIFVPPVIWPIQIHGIVLEAGKNCVIVADFGLTGYGRKEGSSFNHADDRNSESHLQDSVMAAWKKMRPKEDQRLNIVTLTDPREIRKWSKVNYGRSSLKKKKQSHSFRKLTSFFQTTSEDSDAANGSRPRLSSYHCGDLEKGRSGESNKPILLSSDGVGQRGRSWSTDDDALLRGGENDRNGGKCEGSQQLSVDVNCKNQNSSGGFSHQFDEPDWFSGQRRSSEQAVFTIKDTSRAKKREEAHKLPKSDPRKIVLARTNFLLEYGEEILPPYHVFHSNSECIAVWCKTGRWSTLQTVVFLTTNSVGGAKSSTMAVIGVAAAHAVLAPVVAVGGIMWVSAPWIILKKSKEKWEDATRKLTDLFWAWAGPDVFVEAIEHWSDLH